MTTFTQIPGSRSYIVEYNSVYYGETHYERSGGGFVWYPKNLRRDTPERRNEERRASFRTDRRALHTAIANFLQTEQDRIL